MRVADKRRQEEIADKIREEEKREADKRRQEEIAEADKRRNEELELRKLEMEEKRSSEEREANLKRIELDNQKTIRLKELEQERRQGDRDDWIGNGYNRETSGQNNNAKNVKMPVFREDRDCLDAYLLRFERTCMAYEVPERMWALTLVKSLDGKALQVFERLEVDEAQDYKKLKEELLKRFQLTENGYRKKFRSSKRDTDETVTQYVERLRRYLRQWLSMAGFKNDYKGLETLVLRDQFLVTCDDEMRCFLKEKGKVNLETLLEQAQNYVEAREISERKWTPIHKKRDTEPEGRSREFARSNSENRSSSLGRNRNREQDRYEDRGRFKNEWDFRNSKRREVGREDPRGGCFHCGSTLHYASKCDKMGPGARSHTVATMQCFEDREEEDVEHEVTISCYEAEGAETMGAYTSMALVNGKQVKALNDSGATCVAIRKGLEKPYQYTGRKMVCRFANGTKVKYPTALIDIKSKEFEGKAEALVIKNLVKELIVNPGLYEKKPKRIGCTNEIRVNDVGVNTHEDDVTRGDASKEVVAGDVEETVRKRVTFEEDNLLRGERDTLEEKSDTGLDTACRFNTIEQSKAEGPVKGILAGYGTRTHDKDRKERKGETVKKTFRNKPLRLVETHDRYLITGRDSELSDSRRNQSKCWKERVDWRKEENRNKRNVNQSRRSNEWRYGEYEESPNVDSRDIRWNRKNAYRYNWRNNRPWYREEPADQSGGIQNKSYGGCNDMNRWRSRSWNDRERSYPKGSVRYRANENVSVRSFEEK